MVAIASEARRRLVTDAESLTDHCIHLWCADLSRLQRAYPYPRTLAGDEQARAEAAGSPAVRARYIATRSWLRAVLGRYLGIPPGAVTLTQSAHGKPVLADPAPDWDLAFNLSHSGPHVVIAVGVGTQIGVDVETLRPRRNLVELAAACLTEAELERWRAHPLDRQSSEFVRYWTAKEALVKAGGRGLAAGLRRVAVARDFTSYVQVPPDFGAAEEWQLYTADLHQARLALAWHGTTRAVVRFDFDPGDVSTP